MDRDIFQHLLILLLVVWVTTLTLRYFGIPTILGELTAGIVLGPAVLHIFTPDAYISLLAHIGIFFLLLHAGIKTNPFEFFQAFKKSIFIAIGGALLPFICCISLSLLFGIDLITALFTGAAMSVTAVVITIKVFRDLKISETPLMRIVLSAAVIDDIITLILLSIVIGIANSGTVSSGIFVNIGLKLIVFFSVSAFIGLKIYPYFNNIFNTENRKAFTFLIIVALAFGVFAEEMGLSFIFGAFFAGLFFQEKNSSKKIFSKVEDRVFGTAFSFLGPVFFVSLGFNVKLDFFQDTKYIMFFILLVLVSSASKIVGSGIGAMMKGFSKGEAAVIGTGMNGRAEIAFVIISIAFDGGYISQVMFSILITTIFVNNLFTPVLTKIVFQKYKTNIIEIPQRH